MGPGKDGRLNYKIWKIQRSYLNHGHNHSK